MRILFLSMLIVACLCADECLQETTYDKCIGIQNLQCYWTGQYCRNSNNYLLGCDANLSLKLCIKQLGDMSGKVSECIFDTYCHDIYDNYTLKCSDNLSKSGCLSITNPGEHCKWNQGKCISLTNDELIQLNTIFGSVELSASNCGLISGYLIIHNSLLWNLIEYTPDLYTEAQNQVDLEAGLEITITNNYDETQTLQDNYIDQSGIYHWYTTATQLSIVNIQINDYTRYGCIAQEVLTETRFLMLFNLNGIIRGVNHIYCNYLNKHPTNPITTVFINNQCVQINEQQLQDQSFIDENSIVCNTMSGLVCSRFYHSNSKCKINYLREYECNSIDTITKPTTCQQLLGTATHYDCVQVDSSQCYLEVSSSQAYCSNECSNLKTQINCEGSSNCQWLGGNLNNLVDSTTSQFIVCSPLNGCDQLGLNKKYCKNIAINCYWDDDSMRCKTITHIEQLKCNQCNTLFCCSSIIRYDQFCIWTNDQCLNVKDQPLFSHFLSFPTTVIMNFNLCVSQTNQYNYYDRTTRTCQTSGVDLYVQCVQFDDSNFTIDNYQCNNGYNDRINMEYCLSLINSYTRWDQFGLKCLHVVNTNIDCDTLKLVNQNLCRLANVAQHSICLYNESTWSCYTSSITDLNCDTYGINKAQCTGNFNQLCQWVDNQCFIFQPHEIKKNFCKDLQDVSASVCKITVKGGDQCIYDEEAASCIKNFGNRTVCEGYINAIACQQSVPSCFFDNVNFDCIDATPFLDVLTCDTEYISKSACLGITTKGQRCFWGTIPADSTEKCRPYISEFYSNCDSYEGKSNINICEAMSTNVALQFTTNQFCQVVDNSCTSSTDAIDDINCGQNLIVNIHRCVAQTSSSCYFSNYKCIPLQDNLSQYQNILLQQLKCEQSNIKICNQILNPTQVCYIKDGLKCNQYIPLTSYTCEQLAAFDMTSYNPQLCIRATNACYYDNSNCAIPNSDQLFECNQVGASKLLCITQTKGKCIFVDSHCSKMLESQLTTACELRNKLSCGLAGLNCLWNPDKSKCYQSVTPCPDSYDNTTWLICGAADSPCIAGKNGCVQVSPAEDNSIQIPIYIPCWIALSKQACQAQFKFCQWVSNRCIDLQYQCEEAKTLEQCVLHRSLKCVYKNSQCFEINNIDNYDCNAFDYTTDLFCRSYFPKCVYLSSYVCSFVNRVADSNQVDTESLMAGRTYDSQYSCVLQRTEKRYYYYSWGSGCSSSTWGVPTECENFDKSLMESMLFCESHPNCGFGINIPGNSFCFTIPLTCEQFPDDYCLEDMPGLNCYYDDACLTYEGPFTCEDVQGMEMNKQLCLSIMENEENTSKCYYDANSNQCKILLEEFSTSDCLAITDIQQCTFNGLACINSYDTDGLYVSCIDSSSTFNKDLNLKGCVSLTDDNYFFNINKYECSLYSSDQDDQIQICQQLNENLCKSSTIDIQCIWNNNKCLQYFKQYEEIECQYRNLQACIQSKNINCIWFTNNCVSYDNFTGDCSNNNCFYSEQSCISQNMLWDGQQCYSYTSDQLPISFYQCNSLGLNEQLCLNYTSDLTCYWDGYKCLQANLFILQCDQKVSKQTCLSITTPKQTCKWTNDNKCVNKYNSLNCGDYVNLNSCIQALAVCQFNIASKQCVVKSDIDQFCSQTLSYGACQTVEQEYCMWEANQCEKWARKRYTCDYIVNKWGCYNTSMYCQWTDQNKCVNISEIDPMPCQTIPQNFNKVSCSKYSTGPCTFDETTQRCDIKLTSSFSTSLDADQSGFTQIRLTYECTQFTDQEDCILSRIGQCEWLNNQCLNCTVSQCSNGICQNQNQNQCMSLSNYECAWRNNRCVAWVYDSSYDVTQLSLVTQKCCTELSMLIKYDKNLHSCVPLNVGSDDCDTLGLSKYACLHLVYSQCIYTGNKCQQYTFVQQQQCSDYQNITSYVCQQLPHLSCKYDFVNFKCIEIDQDNDQCQTIGLSLLGCTQLTSQPCYWKDTYCQQFAVDINKNQCDNYTRTNSDSCQILNYYSACSYNQEGRTCQPRFNKYSKCSEPGLNRLACLNIVREPCQYINNQCQIITSFTQPCNDLRDVNELACRMNTKDSCAYDPIAKNCFFTLQQLPCTFPGLNKNSCVNQQFCSWSSDTYKCLCNVLSVSSACSITATLCRSSDLCTYEKQGSYCRTKYCDDLKDCNGFVNGQRCYLNYNKQCQGATECEDIVNLISTQSCTDYAFNGSTCIQILNYCVSANNLEEVCINSDCSNTLCLMSNSICQPLKCSDHSAADCQFYSGCSLVENQCQTISSCSDIKDYDNCVVATAGKMKCSWEFTGVYEDTYHCTSKYCQIYNVSPTLCNGNEINLHSCYMDQFQQCRVCEEIQDQCTCSNSGGACTYLNGACQSILCSQFLKKSVCEDTAKCYWSSIDNVCRKYCFQLIKQEDCDALNYECHWNTYQYKCEQGVAVSPDLSVTIVVQDIFAVMIWSMIVFVMI